MWCDIVGLLSLELLESVVYKINPQSITELKDETRCGHLSDVVLISNTISNNDNDHQKNWNQSENLF